MTGKVLTPAEVAEVESRSMAAFTARLKDRICDVIQGEMCEWGTVQRLADESENSLRELMNNMARTVLTRIDAMLDSFVGVRTATKDEFGRARVWVAAEIDADSGDERFWDERDRAVLAEIKTLNSTIARLRGLIEGMECQATCASRSLHFDTDKSKYLEVACNCVKSQVDL